MKVKIISGLALIGLGLIPCCGSSGGGDLLQDPCVRDELEFTDDLPDGVECSNFGYGGCPGFASDCINYCAHDMCQPQECVQDADCQVAWGQDYECQEYVVSGDSFGSWCNESDCPRGSMGCPCRQDGTCNSDPFGSGPMSCVDNTCESECPYACRVGTSLCCGGAFCSGDCIGTPCC